MTLNIRFRRRQIGDLNRPLASDCFINHTSRWRLPIYASTCLKKFRLVMGCDCAKPAVHVEIEAAEFGITDTNGFLQHGLKHWLKIAGGATDDLKHLRHSRLLLS